MLEDDLSISVYLCRAGKLPQRFWESWDKQAALKTSCCSFHRSTNWDPGINIMPRIGHWRVVGYISSQLSAKRHVASALELWQAGRTGEVLSAHTYHHGLSSGAVGRQDSWRCTDHSCGQRCVNGVGELGVLWVLLSNVLYHLGLKNGKKQE